MHRDRPLHRWHFRPWPWHRCANGHRLRWLHGAWLELHADGGRWRAIVTCRRCDRLSKWR